MDIFEKEKAEGLDFIRLLYRNIRLIILFVIFSCLITAIITFLTPKKYESSAVVFPTETNSLDDVVKNPQFGFDIEGDRLMQVMMSRNIMDSIVSKFNLVKYYGININKLDWSYKLKRKYARDIYLSKSRYMAITIYARSKDPVMSANIVNTIISLSNYTRERLLKQNIYIAYNSLIKEYYTLKKDLDSLNNEVKVLTKERPDLKQFIQTDRNFILIYDKTALEKDISTKVIQLVIDQYNLKVLLFYDVQNKLKNAKLMCDRPLPSIYVVENAVPSYHKIYPRYSINLLIAFFGSMILISFYLFLWHKLKTFIPHIKS